MALRDSVLNLLVVYASGPRPIQTQLCVCLASLAIQMLEWKDVLATVGSALGTNAGDCVLDFLRILPEEVTEGRKINLTVRSRRHPSAHIRKSNLFFCHLGREPCDKNKGVAGRQCRPGDAPFDPICSVVPYVPLILMIGLWANNSFLQFSNCLDEPPSTRLYNLLDARDPSNKYRRVTFDGRDLEGAGQ